MTVITSSSASLLPLSLHLVVTIVDDIAFFHATHNFWNNSSKDLDRAAFTFPLPAGCAVSDFSCDFGHHGQFRSIASKVQPRDVARSAFEKSAQAKRPTGLLEQNSTEAFTATIGNIAGHSRLQTHLTYFGYLRSTLPHKGSSFRDLTLTIPSSIAKRYGVPPPQFQGSGQPLRPFLTEYNIHVHHSGQAKFTSNRGIDWKWDRSNSSWLVNYARLHSPPGDFELYIRSDYDPDEGQAFFEEANGTLGHQFAMMVTIPPKQTVNTAPSAAESDIIFLADRSGSMEDKIDALKKAMNVFLKGLPTNRRFNVWCFGSSHASIWPGSVEYNADTLKSAEKQVSRWSANMGGTELLEALKAIDRSLNSKSMVDIIVLTDGQVWDLDSTVGFVKGRTEATAGRMRFFALGIGTEVSHGLVEGIAKYGGGYSEVIQGTNPTIYAERLNAMLFAAKVQHVNSIQVEVDGTLLSQSTNVFQASEWDLNPSPPATLSSPADLSKIGGFTRTRLFLLYDAGSSLLIGTTPYEVRINEVDPFGYVSSTSIPVFRVPNDGGANLLHKAAARALLGDLEFRESWIQMQPSAPTAGSYQEIDLTRQHGELLGCTWGLVSKWTSFYVVETASGRSNNGDPFLDSSDDNQATRPDDNHTQGVSYNTNNDQHHKKQSKTKHLSDRSRSAWEKKKSSKTIKVNKPPTDSQSTQEAETMQNEDEYWEPQGGASDAATGIPENIGLGKSQHSEAIPTTQETEDSRADTLAEGYNAPSYTSNHHSVPLETSPQTVANFTSTSNSRVDDTLFHGGSEGTSPYTEYPTTSFEQNSTTPYQPYQPQEYMASTFHSHEKYAEPAYIHADQQYAEPPYSTMNDQLPADPELVVRSDLEIQVACSFLSNPPTLSAMLDVSSKSQARQKEETRRKYKKEFEMAGDLIKTGKWDGSFENKDTRRLLGKDWFDRIATSLHVLEDYVLIATIAVLVMLDDDRYRICDDMLGPLREKAREFVWNKIEDERYFDQVFQSAGSGYVLEEEPPWKQPQADDAYLQAGDETPAADHGVESAEMGTDGDILYPKAYDECDVSNGPQKTSTDPYVVASGSNEGGYASTYASIKDEEEVPSLPKQRRSSKAPSATTASHTSQDDRNRAHTTQDGSTKHRSRDGNGRDKKNSKIQDHNPPEKHNYTSYATRKHQSSKNGGRSRSNYGDSISTQLEGAAPFEKANAFNEITVSHHLNDQWSDARDAFQAPMDAGFGNLNTHDQTSVQDFKAPSATHWQYGNKQPAMYDVPATPSTTNAPESITADISVEGDLRSSTDQFHPHPCQRIPGRKVEQRQPHRRTDKDDKEIHSRPAKTTTTSVSRPANDSVDTRRDSTTREYDRRHLVKPPGSSSRRREPDRQKAGENSTTNSHHRELEGHVEDVEPDQWAQPAADSQDSHDHELFPEKVVARGAETPSWDAREPRHESESTRGYDRARTVYGIRGKKEIRSENPSSGKYIAKDKRKAIPQRSGVASTSHLNDVSKFNKEHEKYAQHESFDQPTERNNHQPYDFTPQPPENHQTQYQDPPDQSDNTRQNHSEPHDNQYEQHGQAVNHRKQRKYTDPPDYEQAEYPHQTAQSYTKRRDASLSDNCDAPYFNSQAPPRYSHKDQISTPSRNYDSPSRGQTSKVYDKSNMLSESHNSQFTTDISKTEEDYNNSQVSQSPYHDPFQHFTSYQDYSSQGYTGIYTPDHAAENHNPNQTYSQQHDYDYPHDYNHAQSSDYPPQEVEVDIPPYDTRSSPNDVHDMPRPSRHSSSRKQYPQGRGSRSSKDY